MITFIYNLILIAGIISALVLLIQKIRDVQNIDNEYHYYKKDKNDEDSL